MPYPPGHRAIVRRKIVDSARRLFNRSGFENVSVDSIMADAGLTRGGFYSYFDSKSDLYAEVLSCFFTDPDWKNRWDGVDVDLSSPGYGPEIVRAYLSRQHFDDVDNSCPMVALPSDVARSGETVKVAFETVFKAMVEVLGKDIGNATGSPEEAAMVIATLCIGGMVVSRSIHDDALGVKLRKAAMNMALELGGWRTKRKPLSPKASSGPKRLNKKPGSSDRRRRSRRNSA